MKHCGRIVVALALCLWFCPTPAQADPVLLYDVDFGTPPHIVGEPPVTGMGDPPRETPTSIVFGDPTVVAALGAMMNQPCAFGNGTVGYDQLQFDIDLPGGFSETYETYRIAMDVLIESLGTGDFTILCDVPDVRTVSFLGDGQIVSFPGGLHETYELGLPVHLEIELDTFRNWWRVWIDGELVFTLHDQEPSFESLRVNLRGQDASDSAAIDDFRIVALNYVCCLGEECLLTTVDECNDLGGEFYYEFTSCGAGNPCAPTPSIETSWGTIKSHFR